MDLNVRLNILAATGGLGAGIWSERRRAFHRRPVPERQKDLRLAKSDKMIPKRDRFQHGAYHSRDSRINRGGGGSRIGCLNESRIELSWSNFEALGPIW